MFKTKAINAQGTVISIDDGDGTPINDITAVTKTDPAIVSSVSSPVVEGDIVRFIDVAGMPELSQQVGVVGLVTAGASFAVNIDASAFPTAGTDGEAKALVFVPGCEVKTFNGLDGQSAEIDVTSLCSTAREYLPGLQDFGSFNFDVNLVPNDPFQMECNEAKAAGEKRAFKLVLPPGQDGAQFAYVFDAFVRQFTIAGGVDQALTGSVVLRVTGEPVLVEITP